MVLTAGFVAIALLLAAIVVDVSVLFLARRSLADIADGAAARAAQALSVPGVYREKNADRLLPVATAAAEGAVREYLSHLAGGQRAVRVVAVSSDGTTVTVVLEDRAVLPFWSAVSASPEGIAVEAAAQAQTIVAH